MVSAAGDSGSVGVSAAGAGASGGAGALVQPAPKVTSSQNLPPFFAQFGGEKIMVGST